MAITKTTDKANWLVTILIGVATTVGGAVTVGAWTRLDATRDQVTINTQRLKSEEDASKGFIEQIRSLSQQVSEMKDENTKAHSNIEGSLGKVHGLLEGHVGKGGSAGATGSTGSAKLNNGD
jgi:hypothetical protein